MFVELQAQCRELADWQEIAANYPVLRDEHYISELAENIRRGGFIDPLHGVVDPSIIASVDSNHREGFNAHGSNCRYRSILKQAVEHVLTIGRSSTIYINEDRSAFSEMMARNFPYLIRSEYIADPKMRWKLTNIHHQDPLGLSFPDHAFDLYIASDNMIYAASMEGFLREARRVLRRTGVLLATFPFRYGEPASEIRAEIINGEIIHRSEPQYHDDPVDNNRKRLVFFYPGWDILEAALVAGFQTAEITVHSSRINAILGAEIASVFVLKATA